ncbi:phosphoribosylanthranilate isomerase [Paenibacillus mesophilus]|uniref:phosphoribosylanthranilate isomerase n=1 Tax=Paenibacillus mesophilus TaxID=2582849 RepID=UPI00110EB699|nr:phosphoribosylanthranilate isomerase [Paenibacillus mesophilus]TMV51271.1 phosphoribosylanthranilate isomerase [Paenibacillus mesophilus]
MTTVKICGLKDTETVRSVLHLPIDHIGFLFAKSKRQVTPAQAGEMVKVIHRSRERGNRVPLTVGVFVDPSEQQLAEVMREAPIDVIQLHGSEDAAFCKWVRDTYRVQVYRVCSVDNQSAQTIEEALAPYAGCIDGLLLDTAGGGTGRTFEWNRIPDYLAWTNRCGIPLLVAGGLHPDNVEELLEAYAPDGVDVSSGVETDGVKDISKITAFVERVKRHESHASA